MQQIKLPSTVIQVMSITKAPILVYTSPKTCRIYYPSTSTV